MTDSSRFNMIRLLTVTVSILVFAAISRAQELPPVAEQMTKTVLTTALAPASARCGSSGPRRAV